MNTAHSARISFAAAAIIAAGALASAGATSQRPSDGADILRSMHDRYVGKWYRTLTFTQATTRRTPADTLVKETWYESMLSPGRLRIDVGSQNGGDVILYARDSVFRARGTAPVVRRPGRNPLLILGFDVYTQPVEKTVSVLREEGFDLSKLREDMWQGRRVYVVGAVAGDSTSKQFWIDADRLLFVRMLEPAGQIGGTFDIRFDRYQQFGGGWLATDVEMTIAGKLIQSEEYSDVKVNTALPEALFDPATLAR